MKFNTFTTVFFLLTAWFLLTNAKLEPNNPPVSRTGAPGETTCAASGCHSGGTYTGTVSISGVPDTAVFGQSYTITLKNTSNAVRAGFELTCLDGSNAKCGTLTAGSGTSTANAVVGGRQYVRQSTPKNLTSGSTQWTFTWKAPATAANNAATFYFVSLCANNNGKESGDNVLTATKAIVLKNASATKELSLEGEVKVYPTTTYDVLNIDLLEAQSGQVTVLDAQGKVVLENELAVSNSLDVNGLSAGVYVAHVQADGKRGAWKFIVRH